MTKKRQQPFTMRPARPGDISNDTYVVEANFPNGRTKELATFSDDGGDGLGLVHATAVCAFGNRMVEAYERKLTKPKHVPLYWESAHKLCSEKAVLRATRNGYIYCVSDRTFEEDCWLVDVIDPEGSHELRAFESPRLSDSIRWCERHAAKTPKVKR